MALEIGITGTFDVENYGDLLFPIVAEAELTRRLGRITLRRFSYFARQPPDWPYVVNAVADFPAAVDRLDGMLIGGGHIIRFDKDVAPGYFPEQPDIHHPTGYWLMPMLLALQSGCPVAWNAPGVAGQIPAWSEHLLQTAIEHSGYIAVRDEQARSQLAPIASGKDIHVVPDTVFSISRLLDAQGPSKNFQQLRKTLNLKRPYVVVQATEASIEFCRFLHHNRDRLTAYQFVALPIGPALGDSDAALVREFDGLVRLPSWPEPLLAAELIGNSIGVVGSSLHLAITALSFGCPVFRPNELFGGKYAVLCAQESVHAYGGDSALDVDWLECRLSRPGPKPDLGEILGALDRHWDAIADCISARGERAPRDVFSGFERRLPQLLEIEEVAAREQRRLHQTVGALQGLVAERDAVITLAHGGRSLAAGGREGVQSMQSGQGAMAHASELEAVIAARDHQISVRDATISSRDQSIAELKAAIEERDARIAHLTEALGQREQRIGQVEADLAAAIASRDVQIAQLTGVLGDHDQHIGQLSGSLRESEARIGQLSGSLHESEAQVRQLQPLVHVVARAEQLNRVVHERNEQVRALRQSTSWKVTAPLRWARTLARGPREAGSIIRFDRLEQQAPNREPYSWAFANDLFVPSDSQSLVATYPRDHFKSVKGYGDRTYEYEARPLIHLGANDFAFFEELSSAWRKLAVDLLSADYRAAVSRLTGLDLMSAPMEAYVCHYGPGASLSPHVDLAEKIMTHVFYFNENWDPKNGGCLNILRSSDTSDSIAEILPIVGNSAVLVRADNSWHAVTSVKNGVPTSRRSMNVIFYRSGAVSTMWPPGETPQFHDYGP